MSGSSSIDIEQQPCVGENSRKHFEVLIGAR